MNLNFLLSLCGFLLSIVGSLGKLTIRNNCPVVIWPGIQGNTRKAHLRKGGFELKANQAEVIETPTDWAGRIWGRTTCYQSGRCETGDCGKIMCDGAGPTSSPVSFAKLSLKSVHELDHYEISFMGGFNLPIKILPISGFSTRNDGDKYDCKPAGCHSDLNINQCPRERLVKVNGHVVACESRNWTVNFASTVREKDNIFTCRGSPNIHYHIIFCP